MGIFYKMSHIGDEIHGLKPFCTPYETDYGKLKRKDITFAEGDKFSMNRFDSYMITTLVYQYILPLGYLIFAYTRMALKLWRNKIPGKKTN